MAVADPHRCVVRYVRTAAASAGGLLLACAAVAAPVPSGAPSTTPATAPGDDHGPSLGTLIERLSESGAYFDTDNLISNERSFVRVVDDLRPAGGVYLGVGPEQNFNYIARRRPEWAFIVDIRRDNMVQLLLLVAILVEAETPEQYLRLLLSLPPGEGHADVAGGGPVDPIGRIDAVAPRRDLLERHLAGFEARIAGWGVRLGEDDRRHLRLVLEQFQEQRLDLRFRSHGRGFAGRYPTYRELLTAKTPSGEPASFLMRPEDYRFVRELALTGRLVPIVGDFSGPRALRSLGDFVRSRELEVTTFYTSNVEYYLIPTGRFAAFAANVASLPLDPDGLFVRACFDYGRSHPLLLPGHRSVTVLQRFADFRELVLRKPTLSDWELCTERLWTAEH
ncbi:MAG: hypothetical protein DWQ36_03720 [Acidobacteria bacterium]|nr:MAG: hypothetical protein DWQ30_06755 [Acidobacteriota bacterium]REK10642.1 MAG: hypothetical protein DWQ36_03720 [Acidobacteriota bacterium]